MKQRFIKHIVLSIFMLFLGKISYGQISIDSLSTDSIACDVMDNSGCVTVFISGFNQPFNLSILSGPLNETLINQTTSPITLCGLNPGPIVVTVLSPSGEGFDSEGTFLDPNVPLDVSVAEMPVNCEGDFSGSIDIEVNSGTGPFLIDWNTGFQDTLSTTGLISTLNNISTGDFIYTVLDSTSGCDISDTITFEALDSIAPGFNIDALCANTPVTVTNTTVLQNPSDPTTFDWTFSNATPPTTNGEGPHTIEFSTDGNQTISLRVQTAFCDITLDSTITLPPSPIISAGSDEMICINDSIQLSASGGVNYVWTSNPTIPTPNISDPTIDNPLVFPSVDTEFIVTGTNVEGCQNRDTVLITVNDLPTLTVSPDTTICPETTGQLRVSGADSFVWSPDTNIDDITSPNPIVSPDVDTRYFVTGTNAAGCEAEDSVLVEIRPLATLNTSNDTTICMGDTIILSVSGADSFVWSPAGELSSSTGSPVEAFPSSTTNFIIEGTLDGCISEDSILVTVIDNPIISAGGDEMICLEDSVELNASGGVNYIWTSDITIPNPNISDPAIANPLVFPSVDTEFIVTGTNAQGCQNTDTMLVIVNDLPTLTVSPDTTICPGTTGQLSVSGADSFVWSPNTDIDNITSPNPIVTPSVDTRYFVIGTNAAGCEAEDSVLVELIIPDILSPSNDTTICRGDTISITASGADSFIWSPAGELSSSTAGTVDAFPTNTTTFVVEGTFSGCISEDSVTITVLDNPVPTISMDTIICPGGSAQLEAGGGTSFLWDNATTLDNNTIANPIATPSITTNYTVTVSNGQCTTDTSVTVSILDQSGISVSDDTTICSSDFAQLEATGGITYSWNPIEGLSNSNIANPIARPDMSTEYVVQIGISNVCFLFDTVQVDVIDAPEPVTISDTTICEGDVLELFTSDGLSYLWSPNDGSLDDVTAERTNASPSDSTQYTVLVDAGNGCSVTDTVNVNVIPSFTTSLVPDETTICLFDTISLTTTGGDLFTYSSNANVLSPGNAMTDAVPTSTGTITVVATDFTGTCIDSASVDITVITPASLVTSNDTTICSGEMVQISATGGTAYQWISVPNNAIIDDNTLASPTVTPEFTTDFIVLATTGGMCPAVDTVTVNVFPRPNLTDLSDTTICEGETLNLTFAEPGNYTWSPNIEIDQTTPNAPIFTPTTSRPYFLDFEDPINSCIVRDTFNLSVAELPVIDIEGDTVLCLGDTLMLSQLGTDNYAWFNGSTALSTMNSLDLIGLTNDTFIRLEATNTFGCFNSDSVSVQVFNFPGVDLPEDTTICGEDTLRLFLPATFSYIWRPDLEISDTTSNTPEIIPSFTRLYTVDIDGGNGCVTTDSILVRAEMLPTAEILAPDTLCIGDSLQLVGTGGDTREWLINGTPFTSDTINLVINTDQLVTLTTTGSNTCTNTDNETIIAFTDIPTPLFPVTDSATCEMDTLVFLGSGDLNYNLLSTSTDISIVDSTVSLFPSTSQQYAIDISNAFCNIQDTLNVMVNLLPDVFIEDTVSACPGDETDLMATSTAGVSFAWSPAANVTNPTDLVTGITASGDFIITVTSAENCMNSDTVTVVPRVLPVLTGTDDAIVCEGESLTFNVGGADSYTWSPAIALSSDMGPIVDFISPSSAIITVIGNLEGCEDSATINVTVRPSPEAELTINDSTLCFDEEAQLSVNLISGLSNLNGTYSLDNGITFVDTNFFSFTPTVDTTLIIIVRDAVGCTDTLTQNLVTFELVETTIEILGDLPDCVSPQGSFRAFEFRGGTAPYTYRFNSDPPLPVSPAPNDTVLFDNLTQGLFTLEVEDINNCTNTYPINFLSSISFDTTFSDVSCFGFDDGNIILSNVDGGVEPYDFGFNQSTTFTDDTVYSNLSPDIYDIFIRDATGCIVQSTFEIEEPDSINAEITLITGATCPGVDDGQLSVVISGGNPDYTITGLGSTVTTPDFQFYENLAAESDTLFIVDDRNCEDTLVYTIEPAEDYNTFVRQNGFGSCDSDSLSAIIDSTIGGSGFNEFSIDFGTTFLDSTNISDQSLSEINPGIFLLITRDLVLGCIDSTTFNVNTVNGLELDSIRIQPTRPSCLGNDGIIMIDSLFGGARPLSFAVNDSSNTMVIIEEQLDSTLEGLTSGPVTVIIEENNDCIYNFAVIIPDSDSLIATPNIIPTNCGEENGEITLSITGGLAPYTISLDSMTNIIIPINDTIPDLAPRDYRIFISDSNTPQCMDSIEVTLNTSTASLDLIADTLTCHQDSSGTVLIDSILNVDTTLYTYEFTIVNQPFNQVSDSLFTDLVSGFNAFRVTQTDILTDSVCTYIAQVRQDTVFRDSFFIPEREIVSGQTFTLPSEKDGETGSVWVFDIMGGVGPYQVGLNSLDEPIPFNNIDSLDNSFNGVPVGDYTVFIEDANGCLDTLMATVAPDFYIPNIFTPNGDGKNDVFFISNIPNQSFFVVYDRLGSLVYKHRDYDNTWDGEDLPDGVYFYNFTSDFIERKGWVQIIR